MFKLVFWAFVAAFAYAVVVAPLFDDRKPAPSTQPQATKAKAPFSTSEDKALEGYLLTGDPLRDPKGYAAAGHLWLANHHPETDMQTRSLIVRTMAYARALRIHPDSARAFGKAEGLTDRQMARFDAPRVRGDAQEREPLSGEDMCRQSSPWLDEQQTCSDDYHRSHGIHVPY